MVGQLQFSVQPHPQPYFVGWVTDNYQHVTSQCEVSFSIGKYRDIVRCDVLNMNACHMLLSHLLQFDVDVIHQGKANTCAFVKDGVKFLLAPSSSKPQSPSRSPKVDSTPKPLTQPNHLHHQYHHHTHHLSHNPTTGTTTDYSTKDTKDLSYGYSTLSFLPPVLSLVPRATLPFPSHPLGTCTSC